MSLFHIGDCGVADVFDIPSQLLLLGNAELPFVSSLTQQVNSISDINLNI